MVCGARRWPIAEMVVEVARLEAKIAGRAPGDAGEGAVLVVTVVLSPVGIVERNKRFVGGDPRPVRIADRPRPPEQLTRPVTGIVACVAETLLKPGPAGDAAAKEAGHLVCRLLPNPVLADIGPIAMAGDARISGPEVEAVADAVSDPGTDYGNPEITGVVAKARMGVKPDQPAAVI